MGPKPKKPNIAFSKPPKSKVKEHKNLADLNKFVWKNLKNAKEIGEFVFRFYSRSFLKLQK